MKKNKQIFWSILFVCVFLFLFGNGKNAEAFSGGSGTPSDPYKIANVTDFLQIGSNMSKSFILTADIDMSSQTSFTGFGRGTNNAFTGSLDGDGYTIKNMTINGGSNTYVGLFGSIYNANSTNFVGVKNLNLESVTVKDAYNYSGVIAGKVIGTSTTYRASLQKNITIKSSSMATNASTYNYVGGVTGYLEYANINNIISDVDVDMDNNTYSSTVNYFSPMVGHAGYVDANNLRNKGAISYTNSSYYIRIQYVGGIFGDF